MVRPEAELEIDEGLLFLIGRHVYKGIEGRMGQPEGGMGTDSMKLL